MPPPRRGQSRLEQLQSFGAGWRPGHRDDRHRDDRCSTAAVTPRTRLILLNTPHNPTGTVLTRDELTSVAELARERDLLVITDEVYKHLAFEGEHIALASLPGMRERTVTISSAGKAYSFTGWRVG